MGTDANDVVHALQQSIAVLQGKSGTSANPHGFTKRQALLLVAHLVGDIHQPLHVGTAYIDAKDEFVVPASDKEVDDGVAMSTYGDNYLMMGSRLMHAYWDSETVRIAMRRAKVTSPADYAATILRDHAAPAASQGDPTTWPETWANEVLVVAKQAHDKVDVGERTEAQDRYGSSHIAWPVTVPASYLKWAPGAAEDEIAAAGYRLAELLKAIWP